MDERVDSRMASFVLHVIRHLYLGNGDLTPRIGGSPGSEDARPDGSSKAVHLISQRRGTPNATLFISVVLTIAVLQGTPAAAFSCSISATNVAFGSIDVLSGSSNPSTGTLNLTCSGAPKNKYIRMCVSIDGGSAYDVTSRMMTSASDNLRFQLYTDAPMTDTWGSWPAGLWSGGYTWDIYATGANVSTSMTVYGLVSAGQVTVPAASYTSNLGLYLTYNDKNTEACPFTGKGNSSTTFTATATVQASCLVSASTLNFGSTGFLATAVDATSTVGVTCTNGSAYSIGLNAGNGSGATVSARRMTNGASTVTYSLYRDAGRTIVWGNTVGSDAASGTGTGAMQSFTVYGRVPVQTTPAVGSYSDTIVVTVTY